MARAQYHPPIPVLLGAHAARRRFATPKVIIDLVAIHDNQVNPKSFNIWSARRRK